MSPTGEGQEGRCDRSMRTFLLLADASQMLIAAATATILGVATAASPDAAQNVTSTVKPRDAATFRVHGRGKREFIYAAPRGGATILSLDTSDAGRVRVAAGPSVGATNVVLDVFGPIHAATAIHLARGRHVIRVESPIPWNLAFIQPSTKRTRAARLPGWLAGEGPSVIPISVPTRLPTAKISVTTTATGPITVDLLGYDLAGERRLTGRTGPGAWSFQSDVPAGRYLVRVTTSGVWSFSIAR